MQGFVGRMLRTSTRTFLGYPRKTILFRNPDGNCLQLLNHLPENPNFNLLSTGRNSSGNIQFKLKRGSEKQKSSYDRLLTNVGPINPPFIYVMWFCLSFQQMVELIFLPPESVLVWDFPKLKEYSKRDAMGLPGLTFKRSYSFCFYSLGTYPPSCKEIGLLVDEMPQDEQREVPSW